MEKVLKHLFELEVEDDKCLCVAYLEVGYRPIPFWVPQFCSCINQEAIISLSIRPLVHHFQNGHSICAVCGPKFGRAPQHKCLKLRGTTVQILHVQM